MKNRFQFSRLLRSITLYPIAVILYSCEPIANHFDDVEEAIMYRSSTIKDFPSKKNYKSYAMEYSFWGCKSRFFW